jgi:hypothetical protein
MSKPLPVIHTGDRVEMRKAHPCGGYEWVIYRVGMDVGLQCATCGRRVMLVRSEFNKRLKRILESAAPPSHAAADDGDAGEPTSPPNPLSVNGEEESD